MRLVRGEAGSETSYGDPLEAALAWQRAGARWVHLVDLDAAFGRGSNAGADRLGGAAGSTSRSSCPAASATTTRWPRPWPPAARGSTSAPPRWSGRTGCASVIAAHGERIAVGLDVRGTRLAARGWTSEGGELTDVLARLEAEGCARYVVTDVTRDGTLTGCNLDLLRLVCARTSRPVIASGGVSSLDDLRASPRWPRWAWKARSSARRCTPGSSPWSRRSRRWRRDWPGRR